MKYANLLKMVDREMEKGNTILMADFNIVSEDFFNARLEETFIKGLRTKKIPINTTFEDWKKSANIQYQNLSDIRDCIIRIFDPVETSDRPETPEQAETPEQTEKQGKEEKSIKGVKKDAKNKTNRG